jgi:rod shape-determining protein MreC
VNREIAYENAQLRNKRINNGDNPLVLAVDSVNDTVIKQRYTYMNAQVVFNSIVNQKNFITINKGALNGIKPDMAVISPSGIVGVVWAVSNNFATVMSVLNIDYKVSAKLKKNNYYGSLVWEGDDYQKARLLEIPYHVDVKKGDTVVTSNFSNIYPAGIPVGIISEFSKTKQDNFYNIKLTLTTDFKNVEHVYVIKDILKGERDSLELALPAVR